VLSGNETKLNITNVLNQRDYGFSKLTVHDAKKVTWQFIKGEDGSLGDQFTLLKKGA
jgi:hypothetical protein